jgi:hypothetical protein
MKGEPIDWYDAKRGDVLTIDGKHQYIKLDNHNFWSCSICKQSPVGSREKWHRWVEPKSKVKKWKWRDKEGYISTSGWFDTPPDGYPVKLEYTEQEFDDA